MRWSSPFLSARPARAIAEILLVGVILWSALLLLHLSLSSYSLSAFYIQVASDLLIGALCMLLYALRLRLPSGVVQRQNIVDALITLGLSVVLCGIGVASLLVLLSGPHEGAHITILPFVVVASLLNFATFIVLRIAIRLVLFWNRLRRTQLLWALTHSHVMVVALGAGLLIVLVNALVIRSSPTYLLVPVTILLLALSVIGMVAIIPPSALFSYLVVRRTTQRLRMLAAATSALRGGNYAIRVPVVGEDEVAQLQADFNAMATDLERAMRELQGERDTVTGLLQTRRELIANVSHELRTPMATLRSYLETTLDHWEGQPAQTLQRDLQVMENEVIRLQGLVEDLFTLSRAEVGRLTLRCESTDVGIHVRRIVETTAPLAWRSSRIEVVADVPCDMPEALVDASRFEQVLRNLLHNAVRHTSPGGIVAVVVTEEPNVMVVQVKDTGEGIAPEDVPRIWERFYQTKSVREGTQRADSGTGLGLALVKEWVEKMGGSVGVESVLGEGSCFTLRLPLS